MDADGGNIQNEFLNAARRERILVTVFLANGKKLVGRIKSFDKFTLLLEGHYGEQIVFKHAISTVGPARHAAHETGDDDAEPREGGGVRREG